MSAVLMIRPISSAADMKRALEKEGIAVFPSPLIAIDAVNSTRRGPADLVIYMSRNAVRFGYPYNADLPSLGIGRATSRCLQDAGAAIAAMPQPPYNSESLLLHPLLKHAEGKRIRLVKGAGGREALRRGLLQRGAFVDKQIVYERKPVAADRDAILAFISHPGNQFVVATSSAVVRTADQCIDDRQLRHLKRTSTLIAISRRVATEARQRQWQRVKTARDASNGALVSIMADSS